MIQKKYPALLMRQVENQTRELSSLEQWFEFILTDMIVNQKNLQNDRLYYEIEHSMTPTDYTNIHWANDEDALKTVMASLEKTIDSAFTAEARKTAQQYLSYRMLRKQRHACRFWQICQKATLDEALQGLHVIFLDYGEKIAAAKAAVAPTVCDADFKRQFMEYAEKFRP